MRSLVNRETILKLLKELADSCKGPGKVYFDFYTQALSKVERDHAKDRLDVGEMIKTGLVEPVRLLSLFDQLGSADLDRYPSIEPVSIRTNLLKLIDGNKT